MELQLCPTEKITTLSWEEERTTRARSAALLHILRLIGWATDLLPAQVPETQLGDRTVRYP